MDAEFSIRQHYLPYLSLVAAVFVGTIIYSILLGLIRKSDHKSFIPFKQAFLSKASRPGRLLFILLSVEISLVIFPMHGPFTGPILSTLELLWIFIIAWLFSKILPIAEIVTLARLEKSGTENHIVRKISTQFDVFTRIAYFIIILVALASMLMTFESAQRIGMSILASAGIVGIIVGFSAKNTLSTLFSSIQFAITQPIRIDDVVIVENEWGRIEEITLTYVVVKIWDERRLIVPIDYFLAKPFQNWTRTQSEIMGTVFIHADYTVPVGAVRQEISRIVKEDGKDLWDGRVCGVQVTGTTAESIELRVLVSASDAPRCWDLRCLVREKIIYFLQNNYPNSLPKQRRIML